MKKVFIKYNPYTLETELTVDNNGLAQNSKIGERILPGSRLQEWVEDLPKLLIDEYNDTDFEIVFHGTLLDYEDLTEVFTGAMERGELSAKLDRIPAKETDDKERLIDDVFKKIQKGPFDELKGADIINAFENAKSSDFEVCVIATMSAGKSTLINSMLGTKLMPSKQEACTAIITRIKDTEGQNLWRAEVYDKENNLLETQENLTYKTMERLNNDEKVSQIDAYGDIPFVTAEDVSLVLIDTPGPNNARDPEHKKIQSDFLNKSSKSRVLYIMEGTFGSDDDNALLERVAESMKVGGKQSKDRFIFVVNKMDDRRAEDGPTTDALDAVRAYLKNHGIVNPNIFPAAALPALNIRLMQNGIDLKDDGETDFKIRKLNANPELHLEEYATLPQSIRSRIKAELMQAQNSQDEKSEALIHSGVISLEAAIRQYVQKYAKTAKVKNIADTFTHKLEEVGCFEKLKLELTSKQDESERISEAIKNIREKIDSATSAKEFTESVDVTLENVRKEANNRVTEILTMYQKKFDEVIKGLPEADSEGDIESEIARKNLDELEKTAETYGPIFESDLEAMIDENLVKTSNELLEQYKAKLVSLTSEINLGDISNVTIDPLKLMSGSLPTSIDKETLDGHTSPKKVAKLVTKRKWKPEFWHISTWFKKRDVSEREIKDIKVISRDVFLQTYLTPIKKQLVEDGNSAKVFANESAGKIADMYKAEFVRLDGILKKKLEELDKCVNDKKNVDERIAEINGRLEKLNELQNDIASILEI